MNTSGSQAFGSYLKDLVEQKGISKVKLCREVGFSRPYLYAIFSGDSQPPVASRQLQLAECLGLSRSEREKMFDLAAIQRNETPADIALYYGKDPEHRREVRGSCIYVVTEFK